MVTWNKNNRGGVEDTRLEAKAKDTKKIRGQGQGQGQPFRGQTLSRPRTGMLEAKDQGHKAQVLSKKKKKGLHKNFSGDLQKKKKKRSSQEFFKRSPRKNAFQKIIQLLHKILTFQKIVLSSSRGQANFRGLEASRPRPRTSKSVLEDSTSEKQLYKKYANKLTKVKFAAKKLYYQQDKLETSKNNTAEVWRIIKSLLSSSRSDANLPQKLRHNNTFTTNPTLIANNFNDYFSDIGKILADQLKRISVK